MVKRGVPTVSVADDSVQFDVKATKFEDSLVADDGFVQRLLADFGDTFWSKTLCVKEIVDVG